MHWRRAEAVHILPAIDCEVYRESKNQGAEGKNPESCVPNSSEGHANHPLRPSGEAQELLPLSATLFQFFVLLRRQRQVGAANVPLANAPLEIFSLLDCRVALGQQHAHLIEIRVGEEPANTGLQIRLEKVDPPNGIVADMEKDAVWVVTSRASTLTAGMWWGKRS